MSYKRFSLVRQRRKLPLPILEPRGRFPTGVNCPLNPIRLAHAPRRMERTEETTMKTLSHSSRLTTSLAVLLAGSLFLGAARGADPVPAPAVDTQGSISFMTGGVGETERERLEEGSKAFNLRVVTAEPAGNYLSG